MSGQVKVVIVSGDLFEQCFCCSLPDHDMRPRTKNSSDLTDLEGCVGQSGIVRRHGQQRPAFVQFNVFCQCCGGWKIANNKLISKHSVAIDRQCSKWYVVENAVWNDQES